MGSNHEIFHDWKFDSYRVIVCLSDFSDFLYYPELSDSLRRHSNGSQMVRIGPEQKIFYIRRFAIY